MLCFVMSVAWQCGKFHKFYFEYIEFEITHQIFKQKYLVNWKEIELEIIHLGVTNKQMKSDETRITERVCVKRKEEKTESGYLETPPRLK